MAFTGVIFKSWQFHNDVWGISCTEFRSNRSMNMESTDGHELAVLCKL